MWSLVLFYDDAWIGLKALFLVLFVCLFVFSCHNNAHIRTQKELKAGEKATSFSVTIPVSTSSDKYHLHKYSSNLRLGGFGVAGPRVEISRVFGEEKSEKGVHFGLGIAENQSDYSSHNNTTFGVLIGAHKKRILRDFYRKHSLKLGGIAELNLFNDGQFGIHLLPSITTTTKKNKPFFIGTHGVLSLGNNLKGYAAYHSIDSLGTDIGNPWESADGDPWESHFESFRYASTSVGLGLTAGYELIKNNSQSLMLQIDATLAHNTLEINLNPKGKYNTLSYHYNSYQNKFFTPYKHSENQIIPVVSGSLGWVFFKPPISKRDPLLPSYPLHNPQFDPETGEKLSLDPIVFDPETGEMIKNPYETLYSEDTLTQKQIIALAQNNAQRKHVGALWGVLGYTTSIPSGFSGALSGALLFMGLGDDALFLPGFIGGGVFGLMIPSLLAKETSRIVSINYPPDLSRKEEKEVYKKSYRTETGSLRKKSTVKGTYCAIFSFAGFMFLLITS